MYASVSLVTKLIDLLASGVGLGAAYAVAALGFVVLYRATNLVNFAQGDFSLVASFLMILMLEKIHQYAIAFLLVVVVMALFGIVFHFVAYFPVRNKSWLPVVVTTIGASLVIENGVLVTAGPVPRSVESPVGSGGFSLLGAHIPFIYVFAVGMMIVIVFGQHVLFERTMFGKRLQATAQDRGMASLLGISVLRATVFTFAFSAAVGGIAGLILSPILTATIGLGQEVVIAAFAAAIIGGFGSISGAIIGGLLVGLVDSLGAGFIANTYLLAFGYILVIVILVVKPQGLFGERIGEKA